VARRRSDLTPLLERALDEPELLEHLRARMRRLRRPDATRRIVSAILELGVRAR
jgi:UDP-N-acetylglucosamine:LPS N-acetylglucosamine transferase